MLKNKKQPRMTIKKVFGDTEAVTKIAEEQFSCPKRLAFG